jgi:hypothetical protein
MRYLVLTLALLPAAALAGERDPAVPPALRQCDNARVQHAAPKPAAEPMRVRPLKEEPFAGQYLGVLRLEEGCDKPVKIRDDVGRVQR